MAVKYIVVNPLLAAFCQTDIERHPRAVPLDS